MKIKISVPEVVSLIKELKENPTSIFEMAAMNVQKDVGKYLTSIMKGELTHFLGREEYERKEGEANHRNGNYPRKFCISLNGRHPTTNLYKSYIAQGTNNLYSGYRIFKVKS